MLQRGYRNWCMDAISKIKQQMMEPTYKVLLTVFGYQT